MMAEMIGMDVDSARKLSSAMKAAGQEILNQVTSIQRAVDGLIWVGPDRKTFDTEWSDYSRQLKTVSDSLGSNADTIDKQATDQENTSNR